MRALACVAVLLATTFGVSACASSRAGQNESSTDAIQLHQSGYNALPLPLQRFIHSIEAGDVDGTVNEIDVYGPGSRPALVKASSGDVITPGPGELKRRFYLVVLHGNFVCGGCTGLAGAKPPHGKIETHVVSSTGRSLDFGIGSSLPPAVSQLHRPATITLS
jgi:hypothetical protein